MPFHPLPHTTPDPGAATTPPAIVATVPDGGTPPLPPLLTPQPHPRAPAPARGAPSMLVGKGRHIVTGGAALGVLGVEGAAWALDPAALSTAPEMLALGPLAILASQIIMALLGYLRDYGKERLDAERRRTEDALERLRISEGRAVTLEARIALLEKEQDDAREALLTKALAELERLRG